MFVFSEVQSTAGPTIPISLQDCISYSLVRWSSEYQSASGGHDLKLTLYVAAAHPVTAGGKVLGATGYSKHEVATGGGSVRD